MSVIAIVGGTGPEGTGLASRWARAGESIILGSRQADRARAVAERRRPTLGSGDAIICADDPRAREIASALARKIRGVRALDGGKLENARIVEQLTALLITLNTRHKAHGTGLRITGLDER